MSTGQQYGSPGSRPSPQDFEALAKRAKDFLSDTRKVYKKMGEFPYPDAVEDAKQLDNCLIGLKADRSLATQREAALANCKYWAGSLANDLRHALQALPAAKPAAKPAARPAAKTKAEPLSKDELIDRWDTISIRISGWEKPNSVNAGRFLDKFLTDSGYSKQTLGLDATLDRLKEYQELDESDYGSQEDFSEDRDEAWKAFIDSLDEVDIESNLEEPDAQET